MIANRMTVVMETELGQFVENAAKTCRNLYFQPSAYQIINVAAMSFGLWRFVTVLFIYYSFYIMKK
jgi:hypothetical protein